MKVGDFVRIRAPFNEFLQGTYVIDSPAEAPNTWHISTANGLIDFHEDHLESI
jgi:hypothetical protein